MSRLLRPFVGCRVEQALLLDGAESVRQRGRVSAERADLAGARKVLEDGPHEPFGASGGVFERLEYVVDALPVG
jgi:hypothetical protein